VVAPRQRCRPRIARRPVRGCASVLALRAARARRAFTSCQRSRLGECPAPMWGPGFHRPATALAAGPEDPRSLPHIARLRALVLLLGCPSLACPARSVPQPGLGARKAAVCPWREQRGFKEMLLHTLLPGWRANVAAQAAHSHLNAAP